ncbi:MAG: hypothetical protein ACFFB6_05615 [Promethearchaeota archaeon]
MSKAIMWQYNEFIHSRKEKLVNILISEIIFLKIHYDRAKNKNEIYYLKNALDKLNYLVNKLKKNSSDLSENDFDKVLLVIYRIFKDISDNLEREIRV